MDGDRRGSKNRRVGDGVREWFPEPNVGFVPDLVAVDTLCRVPTRDVSSKAPELVSGAWGVVVVGMATVGPGGSVGHRGDDLDSSASRCAHERVIASPRKLTFLWLDLVPGEVVADPASV